MRPTGIAVRDALAPLGAGRARSSAGSGRRGRARRHGSPPRVRELAKYLRPYRAALSVGIVLAIVEVGASLLLPWPLKVIVDRVVPGETSQPELVLAACLVALLGIALVTSLADYWSTRLLSSAGLWIANDLRTDVFANLQRLSLVYHGRRQVGDLSARVTADVDRSQDLLIQLLAVLVPNAMLVAGMFTVMVVIAPDLTAVALVVTPVMAVTVLRSTRALKEAARRARKAEGHVAAAATEVLSAMPVIQTFSLEEHQQKRFEHLSETSVFHGLEAVRLQARFSPSVDLASVLSTAVVLWFGVSQVRGGELSLGVLLVFLSYLGSLYKPVKAIARLGTTIGKGTAAAVRVLELLHDEADIAERSDAVSAPAFRGDVAFEGISFSYGREPVLAGFDLRIAAGETVALVGPSGAGKSTVAALLARLIDPTAGTVSIDGLDVRDLTLESLRGQISFVLQDTVLLRGTLRENIAWGRPSATASEIERAAELALVADFAAELPLGLETRVGERGVNLSGGQRQRVAIARAILRDAPILVLDEPTSALDPISERKLVAALETLPRGRTTLVIAHRMTTIRGVDRICVLANGRIVEQGDHSSLLALGGRYAAMQSHGPVYAGTRDSDRPINSLRSLLPALGIAWPFSSAERDGAARPRASRSDDLWPTT